MTQAQLARCAGLAKSHLWSIEAGRTQASLRVLNAIGGCLGADLAVRYFPGVGPRIHDRFQAPMIEALIRVLHPDWQPQPEVGVPAAKGVLDLVLRCRRNGIVVACECHSELRRLEEVLRRLGEKADGLGGQLDAGQSVSRLLLLRSTDATRSIVRAYKSTFSAAVPARTAEAVAALQDGKPWPGFALMWATVEGGRGKLLDGPPRGIEVGR